MDANDNLFISRVYGPAGSGYAGYVDKSIWPWLKARV